MRLFTKIDQEMNHERPGLDAHIVGTGCLPACLLAGKSAFYRHEIACTFTLMLARQRDTPVIKKLEYRKEINVR
jgi:hypothetical protein